MLVADELTNRHGGFRDLSGHDRSGQQGEGGEPVLTIESLQHGHVCRKSNSTSAILDADFLRGYLPAMCFAEDLA